MSSTTSSPSTSLSSPRSQRIVLWISGAILVAGLAVFLGVFFGRGSSQDVHSSAGIGPDRPAKVNPINGKVDSEKVPASPAARAVARTFLETAVARKNLDVAYSIVGPWLKGESRKAWLTGNNPVQPFPAKNFKTASFRVLSSTKDALYLEVGPLVPVHPTKVLRPLSFKLEVDRIHGKWLVNYFIPDYSIKHPSGPQIGNAGG